MNTLDKSTKKLIERANILIKIKSGQCIYDPSLKTDIKFVIKWKFADFSHKNSKLPMMKESRTSFIENNV